MTSFISTSKEAGVPASRVHVTGIPIHPVFSRRRPDAAIRRELRLKGRAPVILVMSGGFGAARRWRGFLARLRFDRPGILSRPICPIPR